MTTNPASASSPDRATPLSDETYPLITPAECDAFERHAEEGALIDIAGEGVGYSPVQPYDLVRFCRTVRELRDTVTALRQENARLNEVVLDVGQRGLAECITERGVYRVSIPDQTWRAIREVVRAARSTGERTP